MSRINLKFAALLITAIMALGAAPSVNLPRESIYNSQAVFTDDSGAKLRLESLLGTPVVMTFVYTECKSACPLTVERLRKLKNAAAANHPNTTFVLVSLDSEHDSAAALREFRANHKLEGKHWKLLTGAESDIRTLSVLLGYSYQKTGSAENPIAHSNRLVLLDSHGVIVSSLDGLNSDVAELASKIVD